jgi:LysR family glycine cleavage system transcriptional activator
LEEWLDCRVLERSPRAVSLTQQGKILHDATRTSFGHIAQAVDRLRKTGQRRVLTLSSTAAFLSHWLMPRIEDLQRAVPHVDLRLHASDVLENLWAGGIDMAIRYGKGPFPGVHSTLLCRDELLPVCSPLLGIATLADLAGARLIHIDGRRRPSPEPDWARWCARTGLSSIDVTNGPHFPDSMLAVQAAIAGQGVAIVSRILISDALSAGLLQAPFQQSLEGDTYHFAKAEGSQSDRDLQAIEEWFAGTIPRTRFRSSAAQGPARILVVTTPQGL